MTNANDRTCAECGGPLGDDPSAVSEHQGDPVRLICHECAEWFEIDAWAQASNRDDAPPEYRS